MYLSRVCHLLRTMSYGHCTVCAVPRRITSGEVPGRLIFRCKAFSAPSRTVNSTSGQVGRSVGILCLDWMKLENGWSSSSRLRSSLSSGTSERTVVRWPTGSFGVFASSRIPCTETIVRERVHLVTKISLTRK